jgi:hypothetical protein
MTKLEKIQNAVKSGHLEVVFGSITECRGWVEVRSTRTGKQTVINKEY